MKFITDITEEQRKQIESVNDITMSVASLKYTAIEALLWI
jgi:hypothetical protein